MEQSILDEWFEKSEMLKIRRIPIKRQWQLWEKALPLTNGYREIKIPKKRGGSRIISIPPEKLKKVQKGILYFLKERLWTVWDASIQGLDHGSYVQHAKIHSKSRFIFQLDLKDAFPSTNISKLWRALYQQITQERITNSTNEAYDLTDLIIFLSAQKGGLPQGAPTSPFLFYVALLETRIMDRLRKCRPPKMEMEISCYIDGIVISSQKFIPGDIREKVIRTVEASGFRINEKKIRFQDCKHGNPLITGISVDGKGRVSLPKRKIRKWRGIIHRASFETDPEKIKKLKRKIEGFIASLRPIYGEKLPSQIAKPYLLFKSKTTCLIDWM